MRHKRIACHVSSTRAAVAAATAFGAQPCFIVIILSSVLHAAAVFAKAHCLKNSSRHLLADAFTAFHDQDSFCGSFRVQCAVQCDLPWSDEHVAAMCRAMYACAELPPELHGSLFKVIAQHRLCVHANACHHSGQTRNGCCHHTCSNWCMYCTTKM